MRDLENALEDVVSIFEGSLKAVIRRALAAALGPDEAERSMAAIGNACQNLQRAEAEIRDKLSVELFDGFDAARVDRSRVIFEKLHTITHNLGVVDRKFLERVRGSGELGREVWVTADEVLEAVTFVEDVVSRCVVAVFPAA